MNPNEKGCMNTYTISRLTSFDRPAKERKSYVELQYLDVKVQLAAA